MLSEQKTSLCLKQTEQAVSSLINHLDDNLWDKLALKAIQQMPKHLLSDQSSNMLRDFVFTNSQMPLQTDYLKEDDEKMSPGRQKQLAGFAELIKRHTNQSASKIIDEVPQKLATNWKKRKSERVKGQDIGLSTSANLSQTKTTSFLQLFISEPIQEETKKEDAMRTNKFEMFKYNQQMQRLQQEQRLLSEHRKLTQQKKVREAKQFTFDYQGRIISVHTKQGSNIKVFKIKSYFKTAPKIMPKMTKINAQQKLYSTDKISIINNKRLVSGQSKMSFESDDFNYSKLSQKGRLTTQNNLFDLFKSGKQIQMGVSITDIANKSRINGENNSKDEKIKMNLSQFKQLKSAFRQRGKNLTQIVKKSQSKNLNQVINFSNSRKDELLFDSDVESKMMSSSFTHFMQRSGKIKRNDRAYTQNFALE